MNDRLNQGEMMKRFWLDYDLSTEALAMAPATTQKAVTGTNQYLNQLVPRTPTHAGFAHYATIGGSFNRNYVSQAGERYDLTIAGSSRKISLWRLWGDVLGGHGDYTNEGMRKISSGQYDALLRSRMRTFPMDEILMLAFIHEADWYGRSIARGGPGLEPAAYIQACQHLMAVAIDEALKLGRTHENFRCGGLLTSDGVDNMHGLSWPWWSRLPKWQLDTGMPTFFEDLYYKPEWTHRDQGGLVGTDGNTYLVRNHDRLIKHVRFAKALGMDFVLAETAMGYDTYSNLDVQVATPEIHTHWLRGLEMVFTTESNFLGVCTFHGPGVGGLSRWGSFAKPGRELAARELARINSRINTL